MNKNIKLLIENLFDDSDDLFVNDKEQEYNDIVVNNFMIKTKEELYNYIIEKYNLNSIDDCYFEESCPETIDLTDIIVPKDFETNTLF